MNLKIHFHKWFLTNPLVKTSPVFKLTALSICKWTQFSDEGSLYMEMVLPFKSSLFVHQNCFPTIISLQNDRFFYLVSSQISSSQRLSPMFSLTKLQQNKPSFRYPSNAFMSETNRLLTHSQRISRAFPSTIRRS